VDLQGDVRNQLAYGGQWKLLATRLPKQRGGMVDLKHQPVDATTQVRLRVPSLAAQLDMEISNELEWTRGTKVRHSGRGR
jgi:hypothetical protein